MNKPRSLKAQLLVKLTLPLAIIVVLDIAVSYAVVLHYAELAYDRWLLDSARSLTQEVKAQQDKVTFELPPIAVEVFRWDDTDQTFFKVESPATGFLAGDRALLAPPPDVFEEGQPYFFDSEMQGKKVRVVSVPAAPAATSGEVIVSVAETLNKRHAMMKEILLAVVLPQLLLVLITGLHVWTGVDRGLQPLRDLSSLIARRSVRQLDPIPDDGVPQEARSLTDTINDLLERLAAAMNAQRRFVGNAAHQLRTPLAGLKLQAERALRAEDAEAMKPALLHIQSAADRLSRLSTQLLALARSESALQGGGKFAALDLTALVRECCMDWAPKALERHMELEFDAPETPAPLLGDATLLREAVDNLLDNAVRYGAPGGRIGVTLTAEPLPLLRVEDDGPGIPPQEAHKVLERFYRIQGTPGEGCGLGLAIVREIAELHGALLHVGPGASGRGARIEIVFQLPPSA